MRSHTDSTWCSVVIDKPSQVECILLQQLEISEESSEQSIEWLQLKAEPTVVITRVRQMRRRWWSLSQWQQGRKLSTWAEENLKSLQDSALRLYRAIWDYLAVRRAFDRAPGFNRIQFMLCTRMKWRREDQGPLSPKTKHSEGPQNNLARCIVYCRYLWR